MKIIATFTCDVPDTPYRIWIDDELITERIYTIGNKNTVSNTLDVSVVDQEKYAIRFEPLTSATIQVLDVKVGKKNAFYREGGITYAYS
jgi:hypothetical protein